MGERGGENDAPRFWIDFTIYRDDEEVGYGASTTEGSVNDALYAMESIIQNRLWETTREMPEPHDVERVIPPDVPTPSDGGEDCPEHPGFECHPVFPSPTPSDREEQR